MNIEMTGKCRPASIKHRESVIHSTSIYRGSPHPHPPSHAPGQKKLSRHCSRNYRYSNELDQQLETFSLKFQLNILGFAGLRLSVATVHFFFFLCIIAAIALY